MELECLRRKYFRVLWVWVMKLGKEFGSRSLLSMLGVPLKISKQRISMIRLAKET